MWDDDGNDVTMAHQSLHCTHPSQVTAAVKHRLSDRTAPHRQPESGNSSICWKQMTSAIRNSVESEVYSEVVCHSVNRHVNVNILMNTYSFWILP